MATFSDEQFQQILAAMAVNSRGGSFSHCTARFKGQREPAVVEEFLSAVSVFKDIEKISDADALRGMPLLLEDYAASWWIGVKDTISTFKQATDLIRKTFTPPVPDWRIYAAFFETKQQPAEPTDSFVCKKRLLLSQLKDAPNERIQINMLYGLLNINIRDRVRREAVTSFEELISASRDAEMFLFETKSISSTSEVKDVQNSKRCSFCRIKGHSIEMCFKKKKHDEQRGVQQQTQQKQDVLANHHNQSLKQEFGKKPVFSCYGCGAPGVYRSNCPTCTRNPAAASSPQYLSFNSLSSTIIGHTLPTTHVGLFGLQGEAIFDSGAKTSVASLELTKILVANKCHFQEVHAEVTLADGSVSTNKVLSTICDILIGNRQRKIRFICLPNATRNRTLLGADFLEQAGIVLNMAQKFWYFMDQPKLKYDFTKPVDTTICSMQINQEPSPCTKVLREVSAFIEFMENKKVLSPILGTPKTATTKEFESPLPKTPSFENKDDSYATQKRIEEKLMAMVLPAQQHTEEDQKSPQYIQPIFKTTNPHDKHANVSSSTLYKPPSKTRKVDETCDYFTPLFSMDIKILKDSDGIGLTVEQKKELNCLLVQNKFIFEEPTCATPYAVHRIHTEEHDPIAIPPYRLSPTRKDALKNEITKMLKLGVIAECESPWAAPVVIVPKKNDEIRVCVDYRQLNAITKPDRYPLPRVDDILHEAKVTKYMSTIDLQSGYWQIGVHPSDQEKTAFVTPFGMYKFTRMPFGLRNAPATFQRLIDRLKASLGDTILLAYLDDIISCSPSFEQHLCDLKNIFEQLKKFGLKANLEKCRFACSEVRYLGHILTPHGIKTDPEKVEALYNRKEPRNIKELLSFLQACSWYRRFIPSFAEVSKPLSELSKKNVAWSWGDEQQKSFDQLKTLLTTAPILKQADYNETFILKTDASGYALGAVLLQGEGPNEHPIEYASRLLSSAERNYSTIEREALAIVWAVKKYRGYIEGAPVKLITDHQPLKWLMQIKTPTGRLARWALQLQPFDIQIEYKPGKTNVIADTLSRPPCVDNHDEKNPCEICAFSIEMPRKTAGEVRNNQLEDPELKKIIDSIENGTEDQAYWSKRGYVMNEGILYCYHDEDSEDAQLVIPAEERQNILNYYHNDKTAGHYGIERTTRKITSRYYWPGIRKDIEKHVKECLECQRYKATNVKPAGLYQTVSSNQRFEILAIDLFGPLPVTSNGFQWIFIVEDIASRWVELFPLKTATAEACAKILINEVFLRYGIPRKVISDNGVQFVSAVMQKVVFCLNIEHILTPVYHPEANPVERKNRDMKAQLAILVGNDHQTWDENLSSIRFAMNSTLCQSTKYTPAFLTFGRELRTLDEVQHDLRSVIQHENFIAEITPYLQNMANVFKDVKENVYKQQDHNKTISNSHRRSQPPLEIGSKVLVTTHVLSNSSKGITSKFVPKRDGPYVIIQKNGTTSYTIAHEDDLSIPLGTYHASALTPLIASNNCPAQPIRKMRTRGRPRK